MSHRVTQESMMGKPGQRLVDTAEIITQILSMWEIRLRTRGSLRQLVEESGSDCTEAGFGQTVRLPNMKIGDQPFPSQHDNQIMVNMFLASGVLSSVLLYHSVIQADGLMRTAYPACLSSAITVSLLLLTFYHLIFAQAKFFIDITKRGIRSQYVYLLRILYFNVHWNWSILQRRIKCISLFEMLNLQEPAHNLHVTISITLCLNLSPGLKLRDTADRITLIWPPLITWRKWIGSLKQCAGLTVKLGLVCMTIWTAGNGLWIIQH